MTSDIMHIDQIQENVINKILKLVILVASPLVALSFLRIFSVGWLPEMGIHILLSIFLISIILVMFFFGLRASLLYISLGVLLQLLYVWSTDTITIPTLLLILMIPFIGTVIIYLIRELNHSLISMVNDLNRKNTQLIAAEQIAREASDAKSEFFAKISHELRTPMHGILSYASFGIEKADKVSTAKCISYFVQIQKSGQRLLDLLNNLLDISKLESGKMTIEVSESSLNDTTKRCLMEQEQRLNQLGINIIWEVINDEVVEGIFDELHIAQVITNLLSNAIKASPEGGKIFISTSNCEMENNRGQNIPALCFVIRDQGQGIPENKHELVFEKFYSTPSERDHLKGTGLGLLISKEIIEMHHGKLWTENHPDGGAIFQFIIPQKL